MTIAQYGVVFRSDGSITVLDPQTEGRFGGSTRALNQANRACGPNDTYSAVEAESKEEALEKAKRIK